jgi:hypothetical protein
MSDQWFIHSNGEQMGPYTGEQLVQYAQQGSVTAETLVWAEGMAEWAPASQVPGLLPAAPAAAAAAVVAAKPATGAGWNPNAGRLAAAGGGSGALGGSAYKPGASSLIPQAPVGGEYPLIPVKKSSFGLWLGTFIGGFFCFFLAIIMIVAGVVAAAKAASAGGAGDLSGAGQAGAGGFLIFVGWAVMIFSSILMYINIYRAWFCLQAGGPQTTPGKAVGFLFIPLFNIYWLFVAINGLPKDWNRIVSSYEDLKAAPRLSETTFLLFCIGAFFPPLALIMIFPMMSQMCKGINFFAARRLAVASAGYSPFGGR